MSARPPLLSVAIPTYNRSARLHKSLAGLFAQVDQLDGADRAALEVVVCSNGSTDDTEQVVASWRVRQPSLRYFANDRNLGIDENIRRVAVHSTGRHVRFLSDDDVLVAGSLQRLLRILRERPQIGFLFMNVATLVVEDDVEGVRAPMLDASPFQDGNEVVALSPDAFVSRIGVWLTFISSFVVRRDLWVDGRADAVHVGTDIYLSFKAVDAVAAAGEGWVLPAIDVASRPHFSGNYRVFKAFGPEWRRLLLEHATSRGLDPQVMRDTWLRSARGDLLVRAGWARLNGTLSREERRMVAQTLRDAGALRWRALALMHCPRWLLAALRRLRTRQRRAPLAQAAFMRLPTSRPDETQAPSSR